MKEGHTSEYKLIKTKDLNINTTPASSWSSPAGIYLAQGPGVWAHCEYERGGGRDNDIMVQQSLCGDTRGRAVMGKLIVSQIGHNADLLLATLLSRLDTMTWSWAWT